MRWWKVGSGVLGMGGGKREKLLEGKLGVGKVGSRQEEWGSGGMVSGD